MDLREEHILIALNVVKQKSVTVTVKNDTGGHLCA